MVAKIALPQSKISREMIRGFSFVTGDRVAVQARDLLASRAEHIDDGPTGLASEFEALRWFHLPPACLTRSDATPP